MWEYKFVIFAGSNFYANINGRIIEMEQIDSIDQYNEELKNAKKEAICDDNIYEYIW